jgi:hypothetical protein
MTDGFETFEDIVSPMDSIEEILTNQDWTFNRQTENEITVHVSGKRGHYKVSFVWDKEYNAMQFHCFYDLNIPKNRLESASRAIMSVNANLWLGHFTIQEKTNIPLFRHTSLFRGWTHSSGTEHIEDLIELALYACEHHYEVFSLLANSTVVNDGYLNLALMDTLGEA